VAWGGSASVRGGGESLGAGRVFRNLFSAEALRCRGLRHHGSVVLLRLARERTKFCLCDSVVLASGRKWMLAKWFSLTRLETRTKESNICASIWV
jgi:hypothetical protein